MEVPLWLKTWTTQGLAVKQKMMQVRKGVLNWVMKYMGREMKQVMKLLSQQVAQATPQVAQAIPQERMMIQNEGLAHPTMAGRAWQLWAAQLTFGFRSTVMGVAR